jgi:hypothetical protein
MKFTKKLRILVDQDQAIQQIPDLWLKGKETDPNHVQRRMQQRAINFDMMKLAIAYGEVAFHSKAKTRSNLAEMTNYQEKTNQSVQELELISERIAAITKELQNHPEDKDDYKNALEVIVILLNQVIGKLSDQK